MPPRESGAPPEEPSLLALLADLEREADLLVEAARAEARRMVEDARREADAVLQAARAEAPEVERRVCTDEVNRGRAAAEALLAGWPQRRAALETHLAARLPEAVALVVEAVLGRHAVLETPS